MYYVSICQSTLTACGKVFSQPVEILLDTKNNEYIFLLKKAQDEIEFPTLCAIVFQFIKFDSCQRTHNCQLSFFFEIMRYFPY